VRALLALAALTALCASGCDDPPVRAPEGEGRYAVFALDAEGMVRGFRCNTYSVAGGALTATVREVLAAGEDGDGLMVGARVTWSRWVACDLWSMSVRHR